MLPKYLPVDILSVVLHVANITTPFFSQEHVISVLTYILLLYLKLNTLIVSMYVLLLMCPLKKIQLLILLFQIKTIIDMHTFKSCSLTLYYLVCKVGFRLEVCCVRASEIFLFVSVPVN